MKMKCKSNVNDPFIKRNKANNVCRFHSFRFEFVNYFRVILKLQQINQVLLLPDYVH